MSQTTHYLYADGSANTYLITSESLEYIPIKPEESSTGMYSGGKPGKISITREQYNTIKDLLEAAIRNESIHLKDRIKTSGKIVKTTSSGDVITIIRGSSSEMNAIEALLHELLPTGIE